AEVGDRHPQDRQVAVEVDVLLGRRDTRLHILATLGCDDERADLLVHRATEKRLAGSQRHGHCYGDVAFARRALATVDRRPSISFGLGAGAASPSQMIPGGRAISPSLSALASLGCGLGSFQSAPFPRSSRLGGDQPCRFAWWNSVPMLMPLRRNELHVLSWSRSLNLSGHVADQLSQIERPPSPSSSRKAMPTCSQISRSSAGIARSASAMRSSSQSLACHSRGCGFSRSTGGKARMISSRV